ncbi:hypothetical protein NDU88_004472 [Pleurodeles waltl]|uniref:Uncharacterized protein n=1 Tax=Pleurodeles waltl TaxID=8319 RepID=A0AAV7V3J6_PLEWA|nr:hypothetical protein NDU88_004472 [Pleurodeles waltl]
MAGYEDQADDGYYLDEPAGSFEQDLVYALDAGVRHTVNQALVQAIKPIKHHLLGFAEQQGWVAPSGIQSIMEPSLSAGTQATKQSNNLHSADFESLRNMAREHDYNSGSQKIATSDPASSASSDHYSEQVDYPPWKRKKKAHHQEAPTPSGKSKAKNWAHSDLFKKLASSIQKEHGYSSSQAQDAHDSDSDQSSSKFSSDTDSEEDLGDRSGPSKRKKTETAKALPPKAPRVLTFSPKEIIHPRSSSWAPPPEVAEYLQNHIRAGFDKDVRARLRAECPRPDLEGKVINTPDIDPTMVTFLKKWAKDPKKGLDLAWHSCQDKLLDLSGPLAKILEMAYVSIRVEALHSLEFGLSIEHDRSKMAPPKRNPCQPSSPPSWVSHFHEPTKSPLSMSMTLFAIIASDTRAKVAGELRGGRVCLKGW